MIKNHSCWMLCVPFDNEEPISSYLSADEIMNQLGKFDQEKNVLKIELIDALCIISPLNGKTQKINQLTGDSQLIYQYNFMPEFVELISEQFVNERLT